MVQYLGKVQHRIDMIYSTTDRNDPMLESLMLKCRLGELVDFMESKFIISKSSLGFYESEFRYQMQLIKVLETK